MCPYPGPVRTPWVILASAAVVAASACSSAPAPASARVSSPSADSVNVAACRQFAKATGQLQEMGRQAGTESGSALVSMSAGVALENMSGGAGLARGKVQDAMNRAVAAVRIVQDEARSSADGTVSLDQEVSAVRLTLAEVERACREVGADVDLGLGT